MEKWAAVIENENYEVSTLGRIRRSRSKRIKNSYENGHGYVGVDLYKNGMRRTVRVHRLVAEAFIPNVENKPDINHIDGNKLNNNVSNLEWCTKSENMIHAYSTGLATPSYSGLGRSNPNAGRHGKPVRVVETGEIFPSQTACQKALGINGNHINDCLKGRQGSSGGYHFEYV